MKPKVLITRKLPEEVLDISQEKCEVDLNANDKKFSKRELKKRLQDKDGILCLLTDTIDKEVLEAGPNLRIIANCAVGFNNIDVEAIRAKMATMAASNLLAALYGETPPNLVYK